MCGIIGYTGYEGAKSKIKQGLEHLEYRGYDSAGVKIGKNTVKATGRVENLSAELEKIQDAKIGIGHTRWATHGAATKENAHPHTVGKITIVHNGIIENFAEMKFTEAKDCQYTDFEIFKTSNTVYAQFYLAEKEAAATAAVQ